MIVQQNTVIYVRGDNSKIYNLIINLSYYTKLSNYIHEIIRPTSGHDYLMDIYALGDAQFS